MRKSTTQDRTRPRVKSHWDVVRLPNSADKAKCRTDLEAFAEPTESSDADAVTKV